MSLVSPPDDVPLTIIVLEVDGEGLAVVFVVVEVGVVGVGVVCVEWSSRRKAGRRGW